MYRLPGASSETGGAAAFQIHRQSLPWQNRVAYVYPRNILYQYAQRDMRLTLPRRLVYTHLLSTDPGGPVFCTGTGVRVERT